MGFPPEQKSLQCLKILGQCLGFRFTFPQPNGHLPKPRFKTKDL